MHGREGREDDVGRGIGSSARGLRQDDGVGARRLTGEVGFHRVAELLEEAEEVHRAGPSEVGQRGAPREGTQPAELGARAGLTFVRLPVRLLLILLRLRVWEKCRRGPFLERQCVRVLTRISGEQRRFLGSDTIEGFGRKAARGPRTRPVHGAADEREGAGGGDRRGRRHRQ